MPAPVDLLERHRKMRAKLLIVCKAFSLTRDDRIDIARTILRRDNITSYNDLTIDEVARMLDAMEGAVLVAHICLNRKITKVNYVTVKDTEALNRVQTIRAGIATLVDEKLVKGVLDEQRIAIERAKGVERLDFENPNGDEPEPAAD